METRPSTTALIAALGRAFHAEHEQPAIFADTVAAQWFTPELRARLTANMIASVGYFAPGVTPENDTEALGSVFRASATPITLTRARYVEDVLERWGTARWSRPSTRMHGPRFTQYVILGAGLDSYAWRAEHPAEGLRVIELDLPATQNWKKKRIAELGLASKVDVALVPADLATEKVADVLATAGFDPSVPTLFAWMGVTYYLPLEAVRGMFAQLAAIAAPGSAVVFDLLDDVAFDDTRVASPIKRMRDAVAMAKEPMLTGLSRAQLGAMLAETGWKLAEVLGPAEIQQQYLLHSAGYEALPHFEIARAER
ncbi:MAG TPA: SAM-dependent methyltransferase [Kofleriaceae bacterium]|jgi:methyltransferase (TIGR00027 family)